MKTVDKNEISEALKKLLHDQTLIQAMKKSVNDSEVKLNKEIEEFCTSKLGFKHNATISLLDVIDRAMHLDE